MFKWPCMVFIGSGYSEDQGAVGGAGVEDDMNTLHLDEENEQPPLILETDWAAASHALGGRWNRLSDIAEGGFLLWCCYGHVWPDRERD